MNKKIARITLANGDIIKVEKEVYYVHKGHPDSIKEAIFNWCRRRCGTPRKLIESRLRVVEYPDEVKAKLLEILEEVEREAICNGKGSNSLKPFVTPMQAIYPRADY